MEKKLNQGRGETVAREVAHLLLSAGVVAIDTENLFTYASGIRSPMYTDLRLLMGYPEQRTAITSHLVNQICEKEPLPQVNLIVGVATAGIPHAAWVAERLGLPLAYVREQPKGHGQMRRIEGKAEKGWRGVVIEDTLSTGRSALTTVRVLREEGLIVDNCFSVFSYGFPSIEASFTLEKVQVWSLTTVQIYLQVAAEAGAITLKESQGVEEWLAREKGS